MFAIIVGGLGLLAAFLVMAHAAALIGEELAFRLAPPPHPPPPHPPPPPMPPTPVIRPVTPSLDSLPPLTLSPRADSSLEEALAIATSVQLDEEIGIDFEEILGIMEGYMW